MATKTRKARSPLTRRIPDEDGKLVTYMTPGELMQTVQIASATLSRWCRTGAVRYTDRVAGCRNVSVADAARLKRMTLAESRAAGIRRVPDAELRGQRAWFSKEQYETLKKATHHRERWDDYDVQFVLTAFLDGKPLEEIALTLGRSYAGVCYVIDGLRESGDIPEMPDGGGDWWERTRLLLLPDELRAVETGKP